MPGPSGYNPRIAIVLCLILILAATLAVYLHTLPYPMAYDDRVNISPRRAAPLAMSPTIMDFEAYLTGPAEGEPPARFDGFRLFKTRYFLYLSLLMNYRLGGMDPSGYRLANVAIHAVNGMLVFMLILIAQKARGSAPGADHGAASLMAPLMGALAFAVHPLATEGVTYITQRQGLLATMFMLASTVMYGAHRMAPTGGVAGGASRLRYLMSVALAVAAAMSKEVSIVLPLLIALYEVSFYGARWMEAAKRALPHALAVAIIPLAYLGEHLGGSGGLVGALGRSTRHYSMDIGRLQYSLTQLTIIPRYLLLMLLPVGQNVDHDARMAHLGPGVMAGGMLILALLGLGAYLLRRGRGSFPSAMGAFGISWALLGFSIDSSVFPTHELMVEYRTYLPGAGAGMALAAGLMALRERLGTRTIIAASCLIVIMLGALTHERNRVWQDDLSLWGDAARKSPGKARPYNNRGQAYKELGRYEEALADIGRAIELSDPKPALYYFNRGDTMLRLGRYEEAYDDFTEAMRIGGDPTCLIGRAFALDRMGRPLEALDDYALYEQNGQALGPGDLRRRGSILLRMGRYEEALSDLAASLRMEPGSTEAVIDAARALEALGGRGPQPL